jgi:leader peptidase (prepilin peptidase)/N-methyltransferase
MVGMNSQYWLWGVVFFLAGACAGRVVNSLFSPCRDGGGLEKWRSLLCSLKFGGVPLLGWFSRRYWFRGVGVGWRYPVVELLLACLWAGGWFRYPGFEVAGSLLLFFVMVCASLADFQDMEIPDMFTVLPVFLGLAGVALAPCLFFPQSVLAGHSWYYQRFVALAAGGFGMALTSGVVLWLGLACDAVLRKETFGFGDVLLLGFVGMILGPFGALFSMWLGAGFALMFLVVRKVSGRGWLSGPFAFGPFICLGALVFVFSNLRWWGLVVFWNWIPVVFS